MTTQTSGQKTSPIKRVLSKSGVGCVNVQAIVTPAKLIVDSVDIAAASAVLYPTRRCSGNKKIAPPMPSTHEMKLIGVIRIGCKRFRIAVLTRFLGIGL